MYKRNKKFQRLPRIGVLFLKVKKSMSQTDESASNRPDRTYSQLKRDKLNFQTREALHHIL